MADAVFVAEFPTARAVARRFLRGSRALRQATDMVIEDVASEAVDTLQDFAPEDTKRLKESIRVRRTLDTGGGGRRLIVEAAARSDEGFNYLPITREGHRSMVIVPKRSRSLKVHVEGHRHPEVFVNRPYVHGYRPSSDWVQDAVRVVRRRSLARARRRLGATIRSRVV